MAVCSETRLTGSSVFRTKVLGVVVGQDGSGLVFLGLQCHTEHRGVRSLGGISCGQSESVEGWMPVRAQTEAVHTCRTIPLGGLIDKENLGIISLVYPLHSTHSLVYYCNGCLNLIVRSAGDNNGEQN